MMPAPTARARRLRGLLLAVLLCASQAGSWVHGALVSHVVCLEHGEAMHADSARPAAVPAAAEMLDRAGGAATARDGHEHCASAALLRWRDLVLAAPAVAGELRFPSRPRPIVDRLRTTAREGVYFTAPKTSPPSANV